MGNSNRNFLQPYTFANGFTLKNRVVMAPMTTMSSFFDGSITNDEVDYYAERAGGPGMIITGVAYVTEGEKASKVSYPSQVILQSKDCPKLQGPFRKTERKPLCKSFMQDAKRTPKR